MANGEIIALSGEIFMNVTDNRDADIFDVGIIRIDFETYLKLKDTYRFIPKHELGRNHELIGKINLPQYMAIGFPSSKSPFKPHNNTLISNPFFFTTYEENRDCYEKLGKDVSANIIVKYDKKSVKNYDIGSVITGPDAWGMSGCGLWYIPAQLKTPDEYLYKDLIAILYEWPKSNKKCFVGTRIDVFLQVIRDGYFLNI